MYVTVAVLKLLRSRVVKDGQAPNIYDKVVTLCVLKLLRLTFVRPVHL
jgi:hypothetical protein